MTSVSPTSTADEREEIRLALSLLRRTVIDNPFIPVLPTEPQAVFLTVPVREVLYGGAGGGGKSVAQLMAALQYVDVPGYAAILFRRTFADLSLPGGLIPLSHQWLQGTKAAWDGQRHQWKFPSSATLSFGYLDNENDKYRYQGAAFQNIDFDELTQFQESQYRYLFSRLRRPEGMKVPLRMRAGSNPGGIGHEWVKRRFIDSAGIDRLFVPAQLEDNPYLDQAAYIESLNELDPITRRQLRHGDWNVRPEGNMFKRAWFTGKFEEAAPHQRRMVRYWDLAATKAKPGQDPDYASGCLMGLGADDAYYVLDIQRFRESPRDVERIVKATAAEDGTSVSVRIEQEPGSASKLYIDSLASRMPSFDVRGIRSSTDKVTRARPASAASERGDIRIVIGDWNEVFLDELCAFPSVPHDDQVDAFTGAYNQLSAEFDPWEPDDLEKVLTYKYEQ